MNKQEAEAQAIQLADEMLATIKTHYEGKPQIADSYEDLLRWMMGRARIDEYADFSTRQMALEYRDGMPPTTPEMFRDHLIGHFQSAVEEPLDEDREETIKCVRARVMDYLTKG